MIKKTNDKATNAIFLDEATPGKGRYFKARFLETGLVKYTFGVCLLTKEIADKFVYNFVGCPVIVDHHDLTGESAKELSAGNICHVWFNEADNWYWCDGIIDSQEAIDCINNGYSVSCQYEITEYADNTEDKLHNGNEFDKTILNGKPEHLAIVKNPRYENAMIAVNCIVKNEFKENDHPRDDEGKFTDGENNTRQDVSFYNKNSHIIELSGKELGNTDEEIRKNALTYYKNNFQGQKFDNPKLKGILFSRPGLDKLKSNSADIEKIKAIPALKDIVEKGEYKGEENLNHPRKDGIVKFHRINHDVSINNHKENMSVLIGEDKNGNRFYNLNSKTYKAENSSRGEHAKGVANEEFSINIIPDFDLNLNPNITKHESILKKFKKEFWENLRK